MEFLKGKKTYIFAGLLLVAVIVPAIFKFAIPEYAYAILGALGLGAIRLAMADLSENKGWKTFAAVIATVLMAVLQALKLNLPFEVFYGIFGAIGLVGVRSAAKKIEEVI